MKGLLLKDWYCLISYMKAFLLLMVVFSAGSAAVSRNPFLLYYPCILSGMLTVSLISFEEKENWDVYVSTLPCTKVQIVSAKYILSLLLAGANITLVLICQSVAMVIRSAFSAEALLSLLTALIPLSLLSTAILLPFLYKFGSEKGRIAYYLIIGFFCAVIVGIGNLQAMAIPTPAPADSNLTLILPFAAAAVFALSWRLSIRFYQQREL